MKSIASIALLFVTAAAAFGQGSLAPPGPPGPGMKTLQQLWDALSNVTARVTAMEANLAVATNQLSALDAGVAAVAKSSTSAVAAPVVRIVESAGVSDGVALSFTGQGRPMVAYGTPSNSQIRCAEFNGARWMIRPVTTNGLSGDDLGLTALPDGSAFMVFETHDLSTRRLRIGEGEGTNWSVTTMATYFYDPADDGLFPSLALQPSGRPAFAFLDVNANVLRFAAFNGFLWATQVVEGTQSPGWFNSLAYNQAGQPCVSYADGSFFRLRFAERSGTNWTVQVVDTNNGVAHGTALVFSPSGTATIAYYDAGNDNLKLAERTGATNWTITTVDSIGNVGAGVAAAYATNGTLAVSYVDADNDDVKLALRRDGVWTFHAVGHDAFVTRTSVKFTPLGHPAVAFSAQVADAVYYAELTTIP